MINLAQVVQPETTQELMEAMPAVWAGVLAFTAVVGLVLWAFGGRLATKGVMLSGFVLGGVGAGVLALTLSEGSKVMWVLAIGIGGAIAGVLLAWMLFRFWMAGITAVLFAAVVPLTAMIWTGNGPELSGLKNAQDAAETAIGFGESDPEAARMMLQEHPELAAENPELVEAAKQAAVDGEPIVDRQAFLDQLTAIWKEQVEEIKLWWSEMNAGQRSFLMIGAGVGAAVGFVLGLVLPLLAASLQSAMVGAVLLFTSGRGLLLSYLPGSASVLPDTWRGVLLSIGLITLLGLLIQWTLRKKKADD